MLSTPRPVIIGHRGAPGYRPEHTRSSFELAFALGADAVEPDILATRDGVLVVRHENEISGTTNVADLPRYADRRTTKEIDGRPHTGWFTEDFTWAELGELRARERLPGIRSTSASFDDTLGLLRLEDVLELVDTAAADSGRNLGIVVEVKHATYFDSLGLPLDELLADTLGAAGWAARGDRLVVESFEAGMLDRFARRGVDASRVFLLDAAGAPFDEVAARGSAAPTYDDHLTDDGLAALGARVDGISVDRSRLLPTDAAGVALCTTDLVDRAHRAGLSAYCWTLRPENRFLPVNFRHGTHPASFGNYESEWRLLAATGLDGVFVDHPDLAVAALMER
ncbi:glycerophosphodiester phosphodiesterase family protein [Planctomonas psychrotolerans]|uniref:glycerophosphodiester phosphodiesterase family protein n=1 Tax=Planctomonas psychrotolerans TaxID=2528712 RepID=UPI00123C49D8|nr:glycerophosphodiester phosphodiesterase family protein [Planctomonas psychrotolerans]